MRLMDAITVALELERESESRYAALAGAIADPAGHSMFTRLAAEESNHVRVLEGAYWSLNDGGTWHWRS